MGGLPMLQLAVLALVVATTADAAVLCAKPKRDGTFNGGVKIREACKSGETVLDPAALGFCCTPSTTSTSTTSVASTTAPSTTSTTTTLAAGETLEVPFCGFSNATTQQSYAGLVEVTVSGVGVTTPGNPLKDAFYELA